MHLRLWLGLAPHTRPLHVVAAVSTFTLSISFLVFLSSSTSFVLSTLVYVPTHKAGDVISHLIFADEITALAWYLPVGAISDQVGSRIAASVGYMIVALALVLYVQARSVAQLLMARILFSTGASALVTTLSAVLSSLSEVPSLPTSPVQPDSSRLPDPTSERVPLVHDVSRPTTREVPSKSGRLAGMMGTASGIGALIAVFGFLRLPNLFARLVSPSKPDTPAALARGLVLSFYLVAAVALCEALFVLYGLPGRSGLPAEDGVSGRGLKKTMKRLVKRMSVGFLVAGRNLDVALGLLTGFATRAQAVIVTAMIPLLVNRYFLNNDLCSSLPELSASPDVPLKHSCRQAYILASILTGIVQLVTLLCSPLAGLISASPLLSSHSRNPQALVLVGSFLIGVVGCLGFALLSDGDPRHRIVWIYSIGIGLAQAAGTVVSLALMTKGRGTVASNEGKEVGGALSSAYSLCGGLGILTIGTSAARVFDRYPSAPWILLAVVNSVVVVVSTISYMRSSR